MGSIKISEIKNLAEDLIREHGSKFGDDFENNKKALDEIKKIASKKVRNTVAGYITSKMNQIKRSGL